MYLYKKTQPFLYLHFTLLCATIASVAPSRQATNSALMLDFQSWFSAQMLNSLLIAFFVWLQDETLRNAVYACEGKKWKKIGLLSPLCSASLCISTVNSEKTSNHEFIFLFTQFLCHKVFLLIGCRNFWHYYLCFGVESPQLVFPLKLVVNPLICVHTGYID